MVRRTFTAALLIAVVASAVMAGKTIEFEKAWEVSGFDRPESVKYDAERNVFYVSNVVGKSLAHDGNGFISRVSMDGEMLDKGWITGLDAPRGMLLQGDTLWVADIDRVVVIDVKKAEVIKEHEVKGSVFLNDIDADAAGNIFVSDMKENVIFRHGAEQAEGEEFFKPWAETTALRSPNGLYVDGDYLMVASWGISGVPSIRVKGHLKKISLTTGKVRKMGSGKPIGHLDGIKGTADGDYLVTDWKRDDLLLVYPSGSFTSLIGLGSGPADLEYIPEQGMAVIPIMNTNRVVAYKKAGAEE
ncbi:MAG: hypothetical protein R6V10_04610 [bacterium]